MQTLTFTRFRYGEAFTALATIAGAGVALPLPAFAQPVDDKVLSDLKVDNVGTCQTLTINFNIRVQMLSYFPVASGRELHVRIRPLDGSAVSQLREALATPASVPALTSITYEGDNPSGPALSLFFDHDMRFEVAAGERPQSIVIRLAEPGAGPVCAEAPLAPPPASAETPAAAQPAAAIAEGLYVINVSSTPRQGAALTQAQKDALAGDVVYESRSEEDSQEWHRIRAGFFASREAAEAAKAKLLPLFPDAWVVKVSTDERAAGIASRIDTGPATAAVPAPSGAAASPADAAETQRLIGEAEQSIRDKNNDRAIQLLTNALALPANENSPRALELLGLTRERKGQMAHARAAYEDYLQRYPQGEGADRVRQRLAVLNAPPAGGQLHAASGRSASAWTWSARGSFSQFYYRDQSTTKIPDASNTLGSEVDNSVNLNQLLNTADITISGGNDRRQIQLRAAGSYTQNFGTSTTVITTNNGVNNLNFTSRPGGGVKALTALYLDYTDNDLNTEIRLGRQTRNSAGVLGRFDGALAGWQAGKHLRMNIVGGFPVLTSRQMDVLTDRPFYGVSLDFGAKRSPVQATIYWFDQHARGGFVDRRSIGLEARVLKKRFNAFALIDYDVKFQTLNLGLVTFNYNFPDNSNFSLTADYRRSPLLTTSNALIGMFDTTTNLPIFSLDGLQPFFTDPQIYQLARDRTLVTKSLTMSYSRPLSKKLQANLDFTMTDTGGTSATPATAGTPEIIGLPAVGKEYYYGAQLVGTGLLWENDIYILSGRYSNAATSRTWTLDANARVPITTKFRLSPRLRYGHRDGKITPSTPVPGSFSQFQPTLRINYYPIRHTEIEIEFGGNFSRQSDYTAGAWVHTNQQGWVLSAGYRVDF